MMASRPRTLLREFFHMEAAGGIVLVIAAALALVVANSGLQPLYQAFLDVHLQISLGNAGLNKPLVLWINDGLMAVFFLLVGLEIKRELVKGELSSLSQALLPGIGAVGGMAMPAAIYVLSTLGTPAYLNGWAIPAATDIAFSLAVLSLLGARVPVSLKILLTAIAIFDDLGAIVIIAVFYTADLSFISLGLAVVALLALLILNLSGVRTMAPYLLVGAVLWVCVLKSGVHATLAGVALAAAIPIKPDQHGHSPLHRMEHGLHPWVAFGVLPIFGFANAGVSFAGMGWDAFLHPITVGTALGLVLGKQIGVFGALWLAARFGLAELPIGTTWRQIYGLALLCGIGFTMSLFIGGLAWPTSEYDAPLRLGVLAGSIVSALVGFVVLRVVLPKPAAQMSNGAEAQSFALHNEPKAGAAAVRSAEPS